MLYGCSPFAETPAAALGLKPVMTLSAELIAVRELRPGDRVGYGGAFVAERPMRLGVVACGYADGYPRHAPSGTPVLVNGVRTRTVGRVSMDMLTVDLDPVPGAAVGTRGHALGRGPAVRRGRGRRGHGGLRAAVQDHRARAAGRARLTMATRAKAIYACTECGGQSPKWQGQCPHCSAWNTLVEAVAERAGQHRYAGVAKASALTPLGRIPAKEASRLPTGVARARPRARRRAGRRAGGADRRRSRDRQVDAAPAGAGVDERGTQGGLRDRRGVGRAGGAARAAAADRYCRGRAARRDPARADRRDARNRAARDRRDRLDPDALLGGAPVGAGVGGAGARMRRAAHAHRQEPRHRARSSSATSPRRARSPARACSSTSSTRCSTSRATRTRASASSARSRTASGR